MDVSGCTCPVLPCKGSCECNCETCQAAYVVAWEAQVAEKNLCIVCGIPKELSILSLWNTQTAHFYEPCEDCKPIVDAFFKSVGMCTQCRGPLTENNPRCPTRHTA